MPDLSTRIPSGGYLLPLLPPSFIRNPLQEALRLAPDDRLIADAWLFLESILTRRDVRVAMGPDLDRIGARLGLPRLTGETDDEVYRARIIGTVRYGLQATTGPALRLWLDAITSGVPLLAITDPAYPGRASITFFGMPPQGAAIASLIRPRLALGIDCTITARLPSALGLLEQFVVDTVPVDGGNSYVMFYAPPPTASTTPTTGASPLVDAFILDTTALGG